MSEERIHQASSSFQDIFFIEGQGHLISVKKPKAAKPSRGSSGLAEKDQVNKEHAFWGQDDNLPQDLQVEAEFNPLISGIIRLKSEMQYSGGLTYGLKKVIENGEGAKEHFKPVVNIEIEEFLRENNIPEFIIASLIDLNTYAMSFPQIVLNNKRDKIKRILCQTTRAKNCRLTPMNNAGDHSEVHVNLYFGTDAYKKNETTKIKALPFYGKTEHIKQSKSLQYINILKVPDLGRINHAHPDWTSVRNSDWLEVSQLIAQFKKYLLKNQASIKYHVEVDQEFWPNRFGRDEWESLKLDEKLSKQKEVIDEWSKWMSNPEKAGNMQVTSMEWDRHSGAHRSYWKVTEMKGFISNDGVYIEDSREASENIMVSFNMHPEILGNAPGTTLGSGSGSGNRVSFNQRMSMAKFTQDLLLSTFNTIAHFNGWAEEEQLKDGDGGVFEFRLRNSLITTLDTGASATKPSAEQ